MQCDRMRLVSLRRQRKDDEKERIKADQEAEEGDRRQSGAVELAQAYSLTEQAMDADPDHGQ